MFRPGHTPRLRLFPLSVFLLASLPRSLAQYHHHGTYSGPYNTTGPSPGPDPGPTSSSSNSNSAETYTDGGISIPTSTITFIGLAFIVFAILILSILLLVRVRKIRRLARRRRQTFRSAWRDDGGFWGFLNALGGESALVGAGGRGRGRTRFDLGGGGEKGTDWKRPEMWEVGWAGEDEGQDTEKLQPLAILPSARPTVKSWDPIHPSNLPTLNISVLIALPSAAPPDPEELPDLLVGTTTLLPIIHAPIESSRSRSLSLSNPPSERSSMDKDKGLMIRGQVEQVEYASAPRRARWEQDRVGGWHVECLNE